MRSARLAVVTVVMANNVSACAGVARQAMDATSEAWLVQVAWQSAAVYRCACQSQAILPDLGLFRFWVMSADESRDSWANFVAPTAARENAVVAAV